MIKRKVFVFGIDGAPPELIFDKWKDNLPNIKKIIEKGAYGLLESAIPPSTIIAWNSMISGKDASEIGVFSYTFLDKYGKSQLVSSKNIKCKLMWDILSEKNKKSIALYVPLSYPVKPINGIMVSGFLTPSLERKCCYPEKIKEKIRQLNNPDLFFDVSVGLANHKGMDLDDLIKKTYEMTNMQLKILKNLLKNEEWDFFMSVIIGSDRMQHTLWRHFDKEHRRYIKNSKYKDALKDYYIYLDKKIGEILRLIDEDTYFILVSDHGMVKQEGKININNWLIEKGYLVLKEGLDFTEKTKFKIEFVDTEKSSAWGGGAYNARIYINKSKLREEYGAFKEKITRELKEIPDDKGDKINTFVYDSNKIYSDNKNPECPDLIVYFDELKWASNPDLSQKGLYSWKSAVGADNAGHSRKGIFVLFGPDIKHKNLGKINIMQVAPTIIKLIGENIPEDIKIPPINVF